MDTSKVWMFALAMALVFLAANFSPVAAADPEGDGEGDGEGENGAHRSTAALGIAVMSAALAGLVAKMM